MKFFIPVNQFNIIFWYSVYALVYNSWNSGIILSKELLFSYLVATVHITVLNVYFWTSDLRLEVEDVLWKHNQCRLFIYCYQSFLLTFLFFSAQMLIFLIFSRFYGVQISRNSFDVSFMMVIISVCIRFMGGRISWNSFTESQKHWPWHKRVRFWHNQRVRFWHKRCHQSWKCWYSRRRNWRTGWHIRLWTMF